MSREDRILDTQNSNRTLVNGEEMADGSPCVGEKMKNGIERWALRVDHFDAIKDHEFL
ncbi:MAG: hypothetical protein PVG99_04175 [Desulfobacteraceae bacterium]